MSKLYVFGIGGTGSRVLKALTLLLASGVVCKDIIVPILIDVDEKNCDTTRTIDIMVNYLSVRKKLEFNNVNKNGFFGTEIVKLMNNFSMPISDTNDKSFKEFIEYGSMTEPNKALMKLLFSEKNLDASMTQGFTGNPNIGSVVLNQFSISREFKDFADSFADGDKIFIVSSIFGGTGASGFPLLLKTLRTADQKIQNAQLIKNSPIGGITVLPYFNVENRDGSNVDSATFISKAKSALSYYDRNISENKSLDVFYSVADDIYNVLDYHEGGSEQKNNAHIIELISALSIIDFSDEVTINKDNNNDRIPAIQHKEFGIDKDAKSIIFSDLYGCTQTIIKRALTQFLLFSKYLKDVREDEFVKQPWSIDNNINEKFIQSNFYREIIKIQNYFFDWLSEMKDNKRGFAPFQINESDLSKLINGQIVKKSYWDHPLNYAYFDRHLNKQSKKRNIIGGMEQQFVELFYRAINEIVKNNYKIE